MNMQAQPTILMAQRFWVPSDTQAILWDMDGVLIDSLSLDFTICNQLVKHHFGEQGYQKLLFARFLPTIPLNSGN